MREPVKLESVYTAVQFLDNYAIRSFESIHQLEKFYRQASSRRFQSPDKGKQQGILVANEKQYLMVLGGPGAGKSTFLRKIGLEALKVQKGGFNHDCIPVFIELKRFQDRDINIKNLIAEEFRICGVPEAEHFTVKALESGKLLILLDGLDEVPTKNSTNVINQIQYFVDTYDKNRFITSCRVAAYRHNFRRFTDVAMADFDDIQIENFINNWFSSKPDVGKDCWEKLNSHEYTAAKELTQTPLLLTLVCLLYQRSGKIPTNRATLYERALRVLLEEWAGEKSIPQEDLYKGLDTKRKEMILSEIAHDAFQEDRLFFPRREIAKKIENLLAEMLPDEKFINGVDVLKSIEVQHGVLVERADSIYSFSHLTLQEYLTAQYIDDHRQVEKLVTEHLTDERWKEVFLLVAGLMRGGADVLLLRMEEEVQKYIDAAKLQALLNWAEQATTGSAGVFKPVGKRAVAITFATAEAYATANANANANAKVYANAEANAEAKAYANAYANANAYAIAIAKAEANAQAEAKAKANAEAKAKAYAYAYAEAHAIAKAEVKANSNAYAIAKAKAITIANAKAIAIANAKAEAYAEAEAYAKAYTNAIAIANAEAINYTRTLSEFKIFNNVNFTVLIDELNELKTKIPDEKQPLGVRRRFLQRLQQTLLNAFNLSPDTINLSQSEAKALENYLYANHLIIQCKQASVRVSPTTWEAIEARMLLVPGT
ncbi:NACHT domain-containing protein [Nostoc calcicola FACHB-3891]|nr:NACHT domain-containing protein [Nostoc calcicola FACHB-3891]